MNTIEARWMERADQAQQALDSLFWNESIQMYDIETPCPDGACNTIFHYWWMAHAVEALVDGWARTGETRYAQRLSALYQGLLKRNGGVWPNELYDDMEWMAIAWLRAWEATGEDRYKQTALILWADIQTGWNDHVGGGIAWQKTQLDYKNTPANAPAVILAARLYRAFGRGDDLEWARKIYAWQKRTLVDPISGFVWDGANRLGDGGIDKDWKFTYCQGVYIGAGVELFHATGDQTYLKDAALTAEAAMRELANLDTLLLPAEGAGDGGLFKGILIRYLAEFASLADQSAGSDVRPEAAKLINANAVSLWKQMQAGGEALFGGDWSAAAGRPVQLSTQLSGVILLEMRAKLEAWGKRET